MEEIKFEEYRDKTSLRYFQIYEQRILSTDDIVGINTMYDDLQRDMSEALVSISDYHVLMSKLYKKNINKLRKQINKDEEIGKFWVCEHPKKKLVFKFGKDSKEMKCLLNYMGYKYSSYLTEIYCN